jgi:taurine dioxygenase
LHASAASDISPIPCFESKEILLNIRKIAGALGAQVSGFDLRQPPSETLAAQLRAAFLEHGVIFLPGQPLLPQQFLQFARAFGTPVEYPFVKGIDEYPEIIEVLKSA